MKKIGLVLLFIGLQFSETFAQERYIELVRKYSQPKFFIETLQFPTTSKDSLDLLVNFRVPYNFLAFHQTEEGLYESSLSFSVEVLTEKKAVNRNLLQRNVVVKKFSDTEEKNKYISGAMVLPLKYGKYKLIAEFYDNNTQKRLKSHTEELKLWQQSPPGIALSDPIFFSGIRSTESELNISPLAISEKGNYGKQYMAMVTLRNMGQNPVDSLKYEIFQVKDEQEQTLIRSGAVAKAKFIGIEPDSWAFNDLQSAEITLKRTFDKSLSLAIVDFSSSSLLNAKYKLKLIAKTKSDTFSTTHTFENAWVNMPYPLYDIDLALRLMEHILTPEETEALLSGSSQERRNKFNAFWKAKDPTPKTAYNEVMNEFFSRVDYTFFNFYTPREFGWRTDRGKIYILYGKPRKMEREFPINQPTREIWHYDPPISKTFVFTDQSNTGNYKLLKEESKSD